MPVSPEVIMLRLMVREKNFLDKYGSTLLSLLLDNNINIVFKSIIDYYTKYDNHSYIVKDELTVYITNNYTNYKDLKILLDIIDTMYSLDISDSIAKDIVLSVLEKNIANGIINKLLPVITENKSNILATIEDDINKFKDMSSDSSDEDSPFVTDDLQTLINDLVINEGGLKWKLQCLQDSLGSLYGGLLVHCFARPNTGKTSFLASEISNFTRQLSEGECIIWCNNEERGKKVRLRIYNALLERSDDAISRNCEAAEKAFRERNGDSIYLYDSGIIRFKDLEVLIKRYTPRLLVIDVADKVHFANMNNMEIPIRLKELYKHYRELAKEYDIPILTVGQASSEAEGKKFLRPDWMDYSKTAKYGEMDIIIGLGKTHDESESNLRYLNICKNKVKGIEKGFVVKFDHLTASFKDIQNDYT